MPDVLVAGLGAMGSAVAYHLARRGVRVLGIDRFTPPHPHGSSHGETRIIREAYHEHPAYVPLVQRAYQLWEALEAEAGRPLLRRTGALMLGASDSALVLGAAHSAQLHHRPFERLDADQIGRRFPVMRPDPEAVAVYEPGAGILDPEGCVAAHLQAATAHGARLRFDEEVQRWAEDGRGVEVTTTRGRFRAGALVLCVGPWLPELVPRLGLQVERQVMFWFRPQAEPERFLPGQFPAFLWEAGPELMFYGVPDVGGGVKVARHHGGQISDLDSLDRDVREADVAQVRGFLERHIPAASGTLLRGAVCRYTNTADSHFLIDRHPDGSATWVVSPCSGHGFKFASVIGEVLADLATDGETDHPVEMFGLDRFD